MFVSDPFLAWVGDFLALLGDEARRRLWMWEQGTSCIAKYATSHAPPDLHAIACRLLSARCKEDDKLPHIGPISDEIGPNRRRWMLE